MQWQVPTDLNPGTFGLSVLEAETQYDVLALLGLPNIIVKWSGAIVDIPDNWFLCDGNNGTPNLTDKFVIGAGNTYAVGAIGGADTHTHNLTISNANSGVTLNEVAQNVNADATPPNCLTDATSLSDPGHTHAGSTANASSNLPPYYALAYIMLVAQ